MSVFIAPDIWAIEIAKGPWGRGIEKPTARYSEAKTEADRRHELDLLRESTDFAKQHGLHVHMGHGLNYENVCAIAQIPGVEELTIGHSIVSRAVLVGMERA